MSRFYKIEFVVNNRQVGAVSLPKSTPLTLQTLSDLLINRESQFEGHKLSFAWQDEKGYEVPIESDSELTEAIQAQTRDGLSTLRFHITAESPFNFKKTKPLEDLSVEDVTYVFEKLELPQGCVVLVREHMLSGRVLCFVESVNDLRQCGLTEEKLGVIHAKMLLHCVLDMQKNGVPARYLRSSSKDAPQQATSTSDPLPAVAVAVAVGVPLSAPDEGPVVVATRTEEVTRLQKSLEDKEKENNHLKAALQTTQNEQVEKLFSLSGHVSHPSGESMRVYVERLTGQRFEFMFKPSEMVGGLKAKIQDREGIPADQQRLVFAGRQLDDNRTIASYSIEKDSILYLILKLAGC